MTVKERILRSFEGKEVDRIPFVSYPRPFFTGTVERELRNNGFGFFWVFSPLVIHTPDVKIKTFEEYTEKGEKLVKTVYSTPKGEIFLVSKHSGGYGSKWGALRTEFLIKKEDDYKVVEFILKNEKYSINEKVIYETEKNLGEDGIMVSWVPKTPLMEMIYHYYGPEKFAYEFYDRKDLFLEFYELLKKRYIEICKILSKSPVIRFFEIADNITSDIVGKERYEEFIMPVYKKVYGIFKEEGKMLGSHLDGNLKILKEDIKNSALDFIDAFTPYPDTDLTLKEAKEEWENKVIIINFPSSLHLRTYDEIKKLTFSLIEEAYPGDRFIVNITETVPVDVWQESFKAINEALIEYGKVPKP